MNTEEIRRMMDSKYAKGTPYTQEFPFDRLRDEELRRAALELTLPDLDERPLRILDVGSGVGGFLSICKESGRHLADVTGIEISKEAVKQASAAFPEARFVVSAIEEWRPGEDRYDFAVSIESIEHWHDVPSGLAVIHQALRPGAPFVLTTPNRDSLHCLVGDKLGVKVPYCSNEHVHEYGFDELIETVTAAGFMLARSQGVHLAPYWALERKLGNAIRRLTDKDAELNRVLNDIGRHMPPRYGFIQCHRFVRDTKI